MFPADWSTSLLSKLQRIQMKSCIFAVMLLAGLCLSGCAAAPRIPDGEYRIAASGRADFVIVYQDLVFLKVRNPDVSAGISEYWNWAGKYTLSDNGEILFDMEQEIAGKWRRYFTFTKRNDGISLMDSSEHRRYLFFQRIPQT